MRALVLGGAACVWEDAAAAQELFTPDVVVAINTVGLEWPGHVDHWVTLHPARSGRWPGMEAALAQRTAAGRNRPQTWGHKPARGIDHHTQDLGGSSGLLAAKAMRLVGCEWIVLAGVPMDRQPHHYGGAPWPHASVFLRAWERHAAEFAPHVRSMSGWTRGRFGAPTAEWLEDYRAPWRAPEQAASKGANMSTTKIPTIDIVDPKTGRKKNIPLCYYREGIHKPWDAGVPEKTRSAVATEPARQVDAPPLRSTRRANQPAPVEDDDRPSDLQPFKAI